MSVLSEQFQFVKTQPIRASGRIFLILLTPQSNYIAVGMAVVENVGKTLCKSSRWDWNGTCIDK